MAAKNMNFGGDDGTVSLFMCTYSPRVREARQLCVSELFTTQKLEMSKGVRMAEVQRMVATFKELAMGAENQPIDIRPIVSEFGLRNSCRPIFNKAFLHSERLPRSEIGLHPEAFRKWEEVNTKVIGGHNISDIIPMFRPLRKFDVQGLNARWKYVKTLRLSWTTCVLEWYRKHVRNGKVSAEESATDFAETLLRLGKDGKYTDNAIKSFLSDMLSAGSDTVASTLEWTLLELVRHPNVMERLQGEIDAKFGMHRPVEEDEAAQLPNLQAVVKEALRLHNPGVLGRPHCNIEDDTLGGYDIPARTAAFANLWAIHRDPSAWGDDALMFNPDRFLGTDLNVNGADYQFLRFGAGRRICPGRALAMITLCTAVGSFVHAFECSALPGGELNANEGTNVSAYGLKLHCSFE